jgi:hypothetical protein
MLKSEKTYEIITKLSLDEIRDVLNSNTLKKHYLTMERTSKLFIGRVGDDDFSIIHSWFPIGVTCVLNGSIKEGDGTSSIVITSSLHKFALILFYSWLIIMAAMLFITETIGQHTLTQIFLLVASAAFFRLFIYLFVRHCEKQGSDTAKRSSSKIRAFHNSTLVKNPKLILTLGVSSMIGVSSLQKK